MSTVNINIFGAVFTEEGAYINFDCCMSEEEYRKDSPLGTDNIFFTIGDSLVEYSPVLTYGLGIDGYTAQYGYDDYIYYIENSLFMLPSETIKNMNDITITMYDRRNNTNLGSFTIKNHSVQEYKD